MEEELFAPNELGVHVRDEMFGLFAAHYDAVRRATFEEDLSSKDLVILMRAPNRKLLGFTTLSINKARSGSQSVRYIYSGDTVMDANHWGRGDLLKSWFRLAGSIKAQEPQTRLYWFLLVMSHRTYRILGDFFNHYIPRLNQVQDPTLVKLRDHFAQSMYRDYFDPVTGLITFPSSRGQLAARLQNAHALVRLPLARDFFKLNPKHAQGVELACVAELSEANLRKYAKVEFEKGICAQPKRLA